jgi:hypothetical protein
MTHAIFSKITYGIISVAFTYGRACVFARLIQRFLYDLYVVFRSVTDEHVTTQKNTERFNLTFINIIIPRTYRRLNQIKKLQKY